MKVVVIHADGIADEPVDSLNNRTPLEVARAPHLDHMASRGILGLTRAIPRGMSPDSDVGALALLGYEPERYHTGRAALEAIARDVPLAASDVAFRLDLMGCEIGDGGEILREVEGLGADEGRELAQALAPVLCREGLELHPMGGARNLLVWRAGEMGVQTTAGAAAVGRPLAACLPSGPGAELLRSLIDASRPVLAAHPVCALRRARGEQVPTLVWPWGQGRRLRLPSFRERYAMDGAVVAAADVVRGLGALAGLLVIDVAGATGDMGSAFAAKVDAALAVLDERDFVLLHVKAADECAHRGDAAGKVEAIERIDERVVGPMLEGLRARADDWRLLVMPDHPTLCATRRHTDEPVPFVLYVKGDDAKTRGQDRAYTERDAREDGIFIPDGHTLMDRLSRR